MGLIIVFPLAIMSYYSGSKGYKYAMNSEFQAMLAERDKKSKAWQEAKAKEYANRTIN